MCTYFVLGGMDNCFRTIPANRWGKLLEDKRNQKMTKFHYVIGYRLQYTLRYMMLAIAAGHCWKMSRKPGGQAKVPPSFDIVAPSGPHRTLMARP